MLTETFKFVLFYDLPSFQTSLLDTNSTRYALIDLRAGHYLCMAGIRWREYTFLLKNLLPNLIVKFFSVQCLFLLPNQFLLASFWRLLKNNILVCVQFLTKIFLCLLDNIYRFPSFWSGRSDQSFPKLNARVFRTVLARMALLIHCSDQRLVIWKVVVGKNVRARLGWTFHLNCHEQNLFGRREK